MRDSFRRCFRGILLLSALLLTQCDSDVGELGPALETYYPRQVGAFREYDVVDSVFTTGGWVVRSYRLRETGTAVFTDQAGRPQLRMSIDTASGTLPLTEETTHWHTLTADYAERLEGSDRLLVLSHPILLGRNWSGHAYSSRPAESYTYTDLDTTLTLPQSTGSSRRFEFCLRVQQRQGTRLLGSAEETVDTWELYAPGIGRILRVDRALRFSLTGQLLAEGTRVVRMTLTRTSY